MVARKNSTVVDDEVAQFSRLAEAWWDPKGPMRPLHELNPVRVGYVRDRVAEQFARVAGRQAFKGLSVLDVGCGGGLLTEPFARLGARVVGIDASARAIAEARRHAEAAGVDVDYRVGSVEDLVDAHVVGTVAPSPAKTKDLPRGKSKFLRPLPRGERKEGLYDVVTALEIVEHVADLDVFVGALARLLKPKGVLVLSTLNRTPKSFLLGVVAAEYVLRWVPRGTHRWSKFVRPSELVAKLEKNDLTVRDSTGVVFDPAARGFVLS